MYSQIGVWDKMKKLFTVFMGIILLSSIISAGPPMPQPFVIYITFNGVLVEGLDVTFSCLGGTSVTETTNDKGGVMVEVSNLGSCSLLSTSCGDSACDAQYNTGNLDYPYTVNYELGKAPPIPEPECLIDSDCPISYECISEECVYVEPTPDPEPVVKDKVNSNTDGTIAIIESNFGDCIDVVITDNKLDKLFDGIIDFNTEEYDTHEEISLKACSETSIDDIDLGLDPYLKIEEEGIQYLYVFDDLLPLAEIEADEELEINFLGEDIEIISLSSNSMTIRHGELFSHLDGCVEGEEIYYNGLPISIGTINEDFVYVSYNGDSERINYKEVGEVGGIQIYADETVPNKDAPGLCSIRIAEDIEEIIDDGDEYNENWDYIIGEGFIGITNSQEYKYLDEETKPLKLGDKIVLPNDFTTIKVNEITTSDVTEIDIKLRDTYFEIRGNRDDSFADEYDEIHVNANGIYDEDEVLIAPDDVRIGESEVSLALGSVKIGDLTIEWDFLDILYKGVSFSEKDDNYLTHEGIIFKNAEDSVKNQGTFDVIVPDEIPEMIITIGAESETIGIDEPVTCPITSECTEEECVATVCPTYKEPVCPVQKVCEETTCPGTSNNLAAIIITGILGLAGGLGIFFKLFNNKIFLSSNTGLKTYRGRDGTLKIYHKHPGTTGYHNPQTSHRAPEKHPRGMIDVKDGYVKNAKGLWEYK